MSPNFVPDIKRENFNDNHVNNIGWNDTEAVQFQQDILRRPSQKAVFGDYYFDKDQPVQMERTATLHNNELLDLSMQE